MGEAMQEELDIRPYLVAVIRRWPLVLGAALLAALTAMGLTLAQPQLSQARSSVLIVPNSSQVTLDTRFVTRDATLLTNATFQREALITLASSSTLEARVAAALGGDPLDPGALNARVSVEADGDLIWFIATDADQASAVQLAETWASSYELLVAEIYSRDSSGEALLNRQIGDAQQRYDVAQAEFEDFIGANDLVQISLQIRTLEAVLSESTSIAVASYTDYISRTKVLDLVIADAGALRAQVASGDSDALSDNLALLALRARSASLTQLPIQIRFDDPTVLARDRQATLTDLDTFITTITQQRADLIDRAEAITQALVENRQVPGSLSTDLRQSYLLNLTQLRRQYEQLLAQQRQLIQRRDIAFASLEVLQRKRDEQQIAQGSPQITVRYLGATPAAPRSLLTAAVFQGAIGGAAGLLVGVALALGLDWRRRRQPALAAARPADPRPSRPSGA